MISCENRFPLLGIMAPARLGAGTRGPLAPVDPLLRAGQLIIVPSALARALASLMARIAVARASNFFASFADNPLGAAARPSSTSPSRPYTIIRFRRCRACAPGEVTTERATSIALVSCPSSAAARARLVRISRSSGARALAASNDCVRLRELARERLREAQPVVGRHRFDDRGNFRQRRDCTFGIASLEQRRA